ncbi:MAG: TrkH family potassium uptake protein [Rhizobiaceae bacterium]|nr:TrkH family potassium uptake protein [Rhizobiaceae bacterium]
MNAGIVRASLNICAIFAFYLAAAMLIPSAVDFAMNNPDWKVFGLSALLIGTISALVAVASRGSQPTNSTRFTFLLVNMLWLTFALVGSVPFMESTMQMSFADAFFESMSGITTTGATVLTGLDTMPPGLLLWRSILQWVGGFGVIALGLFILPFLKVSGSGVFRVESSDRNERPFARFSTYAFNMLLIYVALTLLCAVLYFVAGMSGFDAFNHSMTTVSTGGFSTHDASFGFFQQQSIQWIGIVFMLLGAMPFTTLILIGLKGRFNIFADHQVPVMLAMVTVLALAMAIQVDLAGIVDIQEGFTKAVFTIVSLVTTTGYANTDYIQWGGFAMSLVMLATVVGGCSGSTSGGIKAYRWIIGYKMIRRALDLFIYPNAVKNVRTGMVSVPERIQIVTLLFFTAYFFLIGVGTVALTLAGMDLFGGFSATLTALSNVGPGMTEEIGPAGTFTNLTDGAKWVMAALMLLGRLEIFAVLVMFSPALWRY